MSKTPDRDLPAGRQPFPGSSCPAAADCSYPGGTKQAVTVLPSRCGWCCQLSASASTMAMPRPPSAPGSLSRCVGGCGLESWTLTCRHVLSHVRTSWASLCACLCALVMSSETVRSTESTVSGSSLAHSRLCRCSRAQSRPARTPWETGKDCAHPTARNVESLIAMPLGRGRTGSGAKCLPCTRRNAEHRAARAAARPGRGGDWRAGHRAHDGSTHPTRRKS
ncbi:protein of unknown function [Streptomyces sp. KY75]|nr:protein of unknown function [Streptomyces sp. KY70]CAD5987706.1 protein of unknown function [Streptomyces sp. KY75]